MRVQDLLPAGFLVATTVVCTGAGLVINEFVPRPRAGEGEWVEVFHSGPGAIALEGYTLADGTGKRRAIPGSLVLRPGDFLVLASRPDSLRLAYAIPGSVAVIRPDGWPILNDRDGSGGAPADRILLAAGDGTVVDSVVYFESWLPPTDGRSLERAHPSLPGTEAGAWGWSEDPAGATPGLANSLVATETPARGSWDGPGVVEPSRRPAVFRYRLPGSGTFAVWLLDREGREVAVLEPPTSVSGNGSWVWGGGVPLPPRSGAYFVCMRWQTEGENPVRRCRPVWVVR